MTPVASPPGNVKDGIEDGKCGDKCWADRNARQKAAEEAKWWADFFENLPRAVEAEFEEGGCARVFFSATASAFFPLTPSLASLAEPMTNISGMQAYKAAFEYGSKMPYPMKSKIYRPMLSAAGIKAGVAPMAAVNLSIVQGLIAEGAAMASGECR